MYDGEKKKNINYVSILRYISETLIPIIISSLSTDYVPFGVFRRFSSRFLQKSDARVRQKIAIAV